MIKPGKNSHISGSFIWTDIVQGRLIAKNKLLTIYKCINIGNIISDLKKQGFWIIGFENSINAKKWYSLDYKGKTALIFGS